MDAEAPNRGWVYLVFGCLAAVLLLGCCIVVPCVGCCAFSMYIGGTQSPDVQIQVVAPSTVRSGEPFDMRVTVTNNTGSDDMLLLALQPQGGGTLELISALPAPDVNQSNALQIQVGYMRIRAGESLTRVLRLRATGQGQMPIMVRSNVGVLKGRSTEVTISVRP